jgi:hypothetical protein
MVAKSGETATNLELPHSSFEFAAAVFGYCQLAVCAAFTLCNACYACYACYACNSCRAAAHFREGYSRCQGPWSCCCAVYVTDKSANAVHFAIVTNVVVAMAKAAAWISTGSATMLSEVFHSLADIGNQTLLSIGITRSK